MDKHDTAEIARLLELVDLLTKALLQAEQAMLVEHAIDPEYGWGEFVKKQIRPALDKAKAN
jgi:hypothetical protein